VKPKAKKTADKASLSWSQLIERMSIPETKTRWIAIFRDDDSGEFDDQIKLSYSRYKALKKAAADAGKSMLNFLWDAAMPPMAKIARTSRSTKELRKKLGATEVGGGAN
jgi:hypothetical protein